MNPYSKWDNITEHLRANRSARWGDKPGVILHKLKAGLTDACFILECQNNKEHKVIWKADGAIAVCNHTKEEIRSEALVEGFGGEPCPCVNLFTSILSVFNEQFPMVRGEGSLDIHRQEASNKHVQYAVYLQITRSCRRSGPSHFKIPYEIKDAHIHDSLGTTRKYRSYRKIEESPITDRYLKGVIGLVKGELVKTTYYHKFDNLTYSFSGDKVTPLLLIDPTLVSSTGLMYGGPLTLGYSVKHNSKSTKSMIRDNDSPGIILKLNGRRWLNEVYKKGMSIVDGCFVLGVINDEQKCVLAGREIGNHLIAAKGWIVGDSLRWVNPKRSVWGPYDSER